LINNSRYIFSFLLVVIVLFQLRQLFIVGHFFIYQDEITAEFCENKDKPELKCDGKCHLKKELATEELEIENPSKNEENSHSFKVLLFNAMSFIEEIDFCFCSTLRVNLLSFVHINSHSIKHTFNFFPPPNSLL
jgi:hypothetical protein